MIENILLIMDILGTVAFSLSGAIVGIQKRLDVFGINILALTTATGGGIIRDIVIGHTPPTLFDNPAFIFVSIGSATTVFLICFHYRKNQNRIVVSFNKVLLVLDTLGLAAFTVDGSIIGIYLEESGILLIVFLGVITGVGGGILRDVIARQIPFVFVKNIYACASILGALMIGTVWRYIGYTNAILLGFMTVVIIRCMSIHFQWNLPKIVPLENKNLKNDI